MKKVATLLMCALACHACPVVAQEPLSEYDLNRPFGWCMVDGEITGGQGGQEIVATTAEELFAALDLRNPDDRSKRDVKAVIYVDGSIEVPEIHILHVQNKTIIGLPGARLYSNNTDKKNGGIMKFSEDCENIIIRNMIFEGPGSYDVDGGDALAFQGSQRIWIDHCDIHDGLDGNLDCTNGSDYITVSWTRFSYQKEPMAGGSGGANDHRFSNLWGSSDKKAATDQGRLNTTFANCWWAEGCMERCPRVRFGKVHVVNCYYSNAGNHYAIGYGYNSNIYAEKCWFDDNVVPTKDYTDAKHGYADYNFQMTGCHNADDVCASVGNGTFYHPSDYYDYEAFDVELVPEVVGNVQTGAGANLMVEVGRGVTGYAATEQTGIVRTYGIQECEGTPSVLKYQSGGRVVILRNNMCYNVQGQQLTN
jgi:pectate lyase